VGGLQPDEQRAGLHVLGEANFSDHGANRLGASALMQGSPTATSSSRTPSVTTWPQVALQDHGTINPGSRAADSAQQGEINRLTRVRRQTLASGNPPRLGRIMWDVRSAWRGRSGTEARARSVSKLRRRCSAKRDVTVQGAPDT
jgi:succinate dehydrogenase / fumarate reductase flavoprotein subunit